MRSAGGVTPLVVGAFAERNKAAHELLADIAKMSRQRISRDFLVDAAAARSLATWHLTQRFGCSAWSLVGPRGAPSRAGWPLHAVLHHAGRS